MSYSSVWMRAPLATAASMTGWIVFCCTLASMRMTTCPPRWIRPRTGGLSFSSVPRPGAPASLRRRPSRPFLQLPQVGPCARPRRRPRRSRPRPTTAPGGLGGQAAAQLLGHGLHIRPVEAQLLGNLAVREVQAHEVQAQHPDPQRLVMPGQHRAGEVVKAPRTRLAPISLPMSLDLVKAIADYSTAAAGRAANTLRPAMLAHQGKALGIV